jgi:hypothetical protein
MNETEFKKYTDRELVKRQRYKQIWKRATNPCALINEERQRE